ncbi:MAG: hypothetical protein ACI8Z1_000790 [Candidatus Azotimanducaceae bacterium]|jgi:hypothetical protein
MFGGVSLECAKLAVYMGSPWLSLLYDDSLSEL